MPITVVLLMSNISTIKCKNYLAIREKSSNTGLTEPMEEMVGTEAIRKSGISMRVPTTNMKKLAGPFKNYSPKLLYSAVPVPISAGSGTKKDGPEKQTGACMTRRLKNTRQN